MKIKAPGRVELEIEASNRSYVIEILDGIFTPLSYEDLTGFKLRGTPNFQFPALSGRQIWVDDVDIGSTTLIIPPDCAMLTCSLVALFVGGWLPPGLVIQDNVTFILDRNCPAVLKNIARRKPDDYAHFLVTEPVRINALCCAWEGANATTPTDCEVEQEILRVYRSLSKIAPRALLSPALKAGKNAIVGLLKDHQHEMLRAMSFLQEASQRFFSTPFSRAQRTQLTIEVFELAKRHQIIPGSLLLFCALSHIWANQGSSPASRVCKFNKAHEPMISYNAAADLRSLEFLMALHKAYPARPPALCTQDKYLALLWLGMNFSLREDGVMGTDPRPELRGDMPADVFFTWQDLKPN